MNLTWSKIPENMFSHDEAQLDMASVNGYRQGVPKHVIFLNSNYTMQNKFSNCFVGVRSTISGFHCHFIASRYKCRSLEKDFKVKQIKNDQSQRLY